MIIYILLCHGSIFHGNCLIIVDNSYDISGELSIINNVKPYLFLNEATTIDYIAYCFCLYV